MNIGSVKVLDFHEYIGVYRKGFFAPVFKFAKKEVEERIGFIDSP